MAKRKNVLNLKKDINNILRERLRPRKQTLDQNLLTVPENDNNLMSPMLKLTKNKSQKVRMARRSMILNMSTSVHNALSNLQESYDKCKRASIDLSHTLKQGSLNKMLLNHSTHSSCNIMRQQNISKSRNWSVLSRRKGGMSQSKYKFPTNPHILRNGMVSLFV